MDLNASPSPEEDDQSYEEHADFSQSEHAESAVEIMRRVNKILSCFKPCNCFAALEEHSP
jgi:hypothetical protein